ncbi:MAG: hypothetical protein ABIP30_08375 [Ferruginibacter sp.]
MILLPAFVPDCYRDHGSSACLPVGRLCHSLVQQTVGEHYLCFTPKNP